MPYRIIVVGAGISGLSTALTLQAAGHQVRVLTRELPAETTSAVAAAIWFPYAVAPMEKANPWGLATFRQLLVDAKATGSGVYLTDFLVLTSDPAETAWLKGIPDGYVRAANPEELPKGYHQGYIARVPLAETQHYLPWLVQRLQDEGGQLKQVTVASLDKLLDHCDWVVNCSGLGARQLAQDETLFPVRGQVLQLQPQPGLRSWVDDHGPNALAYLINRSDGIILGGTAERYQYDLRPRKDVQEAILERCRRIEPNFHSDSLKAVQVGLRPGRPSVRLEREPDRAIVHNYGHGGAGFTLCWGCAREVAQLVSGGRVGRMLRAT